MARKSYAEVYNSEEEEDDDEEEGSGSEADEDNEFEKCVFQCALSAVAGCARPLV